MMAYDKLSNFVYYRQLLVGVNRHLTPDTTQLLNNN